MFGFKSNAYDWLVLNSKQEGLQLVGFKYQKADDWLDIKFHCSYLESRGVPEKNAGNTGKTREIISLSLPVSVTSFLVMQLPVTSFPVTSQSSQILHKY